MKVISILKLTAHENYRGQILWVATVVALVTLGLTGFLSEAALSHQGRLVDVASYFLLDMVCFFTAMFMGSGIFVRDFSNRGLAELAIPGGMSRETLYLVRLVSHALCLAGLVLALGMGRLLVMSAVEATTPTLLVDSLRMLAFSFLKATLALAVGAFFGSVTRPVVALLGTLGFFAAGHFSTGMTGIQGVISESRLLSPWENGLLRLFRIWNPNYLVLESLKGAWENPSTQEFLGRLAWGAAAFAVFAFAGAWGVRRRDIGAFRLG